ncbi:methionine--tRNA ligase, mitochondrial-like [Mizuhopecten yessoensis]|uniref:Methionine--tRNA ligase, mitochondrial n=1 Tax=Mizuhopecten yessoensis TaxID=6573 RepID=A0A210PZE5_MIZYE|nr:methionine--tRNA ligase, mitochondrial-like [Mizuhopecten yessoensis]OWF41858.1 Methionine--tRNA ligase, mitochondrial [Mizuhopecten yessoensis]
MIIKLTNPSTKLKSLNYARVFLKRQQIFLGRLNWLQTTSSCLSTSRSQEQRPDKKPFYVSTPIFYVNASPHIGHLYTALVADSLSRWKKLKGYETFFATGTDEHGLKIQQAAGKADIAPKVFCDEVSSKFKDLFEKNDIKYDTFIRTTDDAHIKAVHQLWNVLNEKGFIYKSLYKGWYCVSDETFVSENDTTDVTTKSGESQKVSVESGHPVIWSEEENYMFTLSRFKPQLQQWIDTGVIQPPEFKRIVQGHLDDLSDLSVTRSSDRVSWGISVPGDPSQKIYVWLDALTNYLTVTGYPGDEYRSLWPADCHVVGKDILKFHAVYWPAFLLAAGLSLPKKILCHSHWKVDGVKMSKSLGNVVDPLDCMPKYTVDGLRYFLLRQATPQSDADFSETRIVEVINSELVNTIGNALSRISGKAVNPLQVFPNPSAEALRTKFTTEDRQRLDQLYGLADEVDRFYEDGNVYLVLQTVMDYMFWANKLIQDHEPWVLVKTESEKEHLDTLIYIAMETLRVCGILVQPVVPDFSSRLLTRLGVPDSERDIVHSKVKVQPASSGYVQILNPTESVLFKRLK